jgi:hypothetical protein
MHSERHFPHLRNAGMDSPGPRASYWYRTLYTATKLVSSIRPTLRDRWARLCFARASLAASPAEWNRVLYLIGLGGFHTKCT